MDLRKLKTLIDLVSESGISELEVNEGEDRVRIVNAKLAQGQPSTTPITYAAAAPAPIAVSAPVPAAPTAAEHAAEPLLKTSASSEPSSAASFLFPNACDCTFAALFPYYCNSNVLCMYAAEICLALT